MNPSEGVKVAISIACGFYFVVVAIALRIVWKLALEDKKEEGE